MELVFTTEIPVKVHDQFRCFLGGILYHLFERFGIELEYMIVDNDTLKVNPLTDKILQEINGSITNEVTMGAVAWSNELALHVIELKTSEPVKSIENIGRLFHSDIQKINCLLEKYNARLMGGPMHPFMDPVKEMRLWPHDYSPIYDAFDHIFSCKGHGWANLQSMHINLPFANDEEFGKLHAAIRLVLPIICALSAGSPIADGKISGFHDTRMETYRTNSIKIPSITGQVIPEAVFTQAQYEEKILKRIYDDLAPYDPEKILQEEWVNARGAIARFERNTIEIRIIDVQENPFMDQAIAAAVIETIKMLVDEELSSYDFQKSIPVEPLESVFRAVIETGENALVTDENYLRALGLPAHAITAGEVWKVLISRISKRSNSAIPMYFEPLDTILSKGSLSTRILKKSGHNPSAEKLIEICQQMCNCLQDGTMFN